MIIYENYLDKEFEIDTDSIYENEENLKKFERYIEKKIEFFLPVEVRIMAKKAILSYCRENKIYIIHKFKEYYGISEVINEFNPREISSEIKVFDKNRTYPLQEIELKLDWRY